MGQSHSSMGETLARFLDSLCAFQSAASFEFLSYLGSSMFLAVLRLLRLTYQRTNAAIAIIGLEASAGGARSKRAWHARMLSRAVHMLRSQVLQSFERTLRRAREECSFELLPPER